MQWIVYIALACLLASACGGSRTASTPVPEGTELRADVIVKKQPDGPTVGVQFYYAGSVASGNQSLSAARQYVTAENAAMNGVAMVQEDDGAGRPVYKADTSAMKSTNVVTASVGGRQYEATVQVVLMVGDRVVSTVLKPK